MQESLVSAGQKDESVQRLIDRLERTFAALDQDEALARIARYLRAGVAESRGGEGEESDTLDPVTS
jgi:hypothetical protein